ncbi:MAG: DNA polymerase III subunit epsilon [Candidatus Pacebacteria bacterium]|nr:DNA polymerase III subunit epsilon [Candidatus Paceibacterota bacterium]
MTQLNRKIIFDIETTGLSPQKDRIVEIGAVEVVNLVPTGRSLQFYCNPERDVPEEVVRIHGLTGEFLRPFPNFAAQVDGLIEFIGDSDLVIHNAEFDLGFLNAELQRCQRPIYPASRAECTMILARKKFPGSPASLNDLCRRFGIGLEGRTLHGALLDSQLLAAVYLELYGGRQTGLSLSNDSKTGLKNTESAGTSTNPVKVSRPPRPARQFDASEDELLAHQIAIEKLDKIQSKSNPDSGKTSLWTTVNKGQ